MLGLGACGGGDTPGVSQGTDLANGREHFVEECASCHTLEAAGPGGSIGPNLDDAFSASREQGFEESTFEQVVRSQISYPGVDSVMQPDLVTGQDADDVAYFVAQCAAVAGEDPQCAPPPAPGGGGETDGEAIFATNCASCHTLAAAGSSGTVGPNLDDSQPSLELAVDRVTNGQGAMPSFSGQLSEEQIQAVAEYVVQSTGG